MPIRVLHIVTYMGRGGLETLLMNYYRKIDRNKVQFDFLVHRSFKADYDDEIHLLGGRIYHLPRLNPLDPAYLKKLDLFFERHQEYRIVHSHLDCMSGVVLKYAKKWGIPIRIAHAHSSSQTKDIKYPVKLYFRTWITQYANILFACGQEAGVWMFKGKRFVILNNAIDIEKYVYNPESRKRIRNQLSICQESFVVGHVGQFRVEKNHQFIIRIFEEVHKREKQAVLLLVGDGSQREAINSLVREKQLSDYVVFTGLRTDVPELLQAMDVFLLPSMYEGLPLSIIEAQASGLPCFISDRVPAECAKTDLVRQKKLSESPETWADEILECQSVERCDQTEKIAQKGFDINSNAKKLQNFYLKLYYKENNN